MRKILSSIMFVAAAAMAFTSCQKEETAAPETVSATLTMHAGVEETKTYLGENNAVLWGKGEAVTLYVGAGETAKFFDSASTDDYDGVASASFTFAIEDVAQADSYALGGIYPASAAVDDNKNAAQYKVILPATQNQVDGNYDPSAYIMVLKPEVVTELPAEYTASFRRAVALNKITLKGLKETITSVTITVPEEKFLAGRRYFDLTTGEEGEIYHAQSNSITVNGTYAPGEVNVWFTSWGVELAQGEQMTVKMTSTTKTYTRTITVNENGVRFVEGDLNTLTVNMSSADEVVLNDLSGEYLIAGKEGDKWYAAKKYTSGNYLAVSEIEFIGENIVETEAISDHYMTITKVVGGDYDGMYTIVDAGGKYLATSSSDNNYMKAESSASANTYWTIVKDDAKGTYSIVASKSDYTRNDMRFNYNSGTNSRVSCYDGTKTAQPYLALFSTSLVKPDTTPKLELSEESIELTAAGGKGTIAVTAKNLPADIQVRVLTAEGAQDEVEWLTAEYADETTITYTAAANESTEARTAYIEVYVSDDLKTGVSVTQAGKPAEGAPVEVTDVLTRATTGVTKNSTSYSEWSGKTSNSEAVYAGQSAGGNDAIQLRTTNSNSGVVTTTSGGKVKKIKVTWQSATSSDRTLDIYGKNTAYTAATDLYNTSTQGTKLGSIKYGTSTELEINGDYEYIGLRSNSGAMYLTEIEITWETNSGSGSGETPDPELQERNLTFSSTTATATVGEDFTEPTLSGATTGVTYSSSNTSVATVNESTGAVTLVAAGETTITATAAADATYKAGEASYTLTVNPADEGGDDQPGDNEPVVVLSESFSNSTGTMGWSGNAGNGTFVTDNTGWVCENAYGAGGSAKFGTGSKKGTATTPALGSEGDMVLTFKAGAWNGSSEQTTLILSISGGGSLSMSSVTMEKGVWGEYTVNISGATKQTTITFSGKNASSSRFLLDDVKIVKN